MRLDLLLFQKGLVKSRSRAKAMIEEGNVEIDGKVVLQPAFQADDTATVRILDTLRYVSRGGMKLEAALRAFSIDCNGKVVIDIGASSGGFTDCLLQNGASFVYAVDTGSGQLAPSLARDARVKSLENYNARYLNENDFDKKPSLAVMDVSFISQTLILPSLSKLLPLGGEAVTLIKPQFEAGRAAVGKGGIVHKEADRKRALDRVFECAAALGFTLIGSMQSPITGGDGNVEYLGYFKKTKEIVL